MQGQTLCLPDGNQKFNSLKGIIYSMEQRDYYRILGVEKNAPAKKIKEAYRTLALKYHPDRNNSDPRAAEQMKAVNEAYAVLSNPEKRQAYDTLHDQFGSSAYSHFRKNYTDQDIFSGSDINRILEEMARSFGFRGFDDIFKEFYGKKYQSFDFKKQGFSMRGFVFQGYLNRQGKGRINSGGIAPGGTLGKFTRNLIGKLSGVKIPEKGADIHEILRIPSLQAMQGGPYAYYLKKKSKKLIVKIPQGIRDGQRIRLKNMGENGRAGGENGDLYLKIIIKKKLFGKIKTAVASLRK